MAGVERVLEVVHGVGDVVGPVHDLRLEAAPAAPARPSRSQVKTGRSSSYTPNLRSPDVGRRVHGYFVAASSVARVRLSPTLRPSAEKVLASSRVSTRRLCALPSKPPQPRATSSSAASPLCPNGGWPRSCARHAVSTRSGSQPSAAPSSRPICAHLERVGQPGPREVALPRARPPGSWPPAGGARRECSTRARSRSNGAAARRAWPARRTQRARACSSYAGDVGVASRP